MNYGYPNYGAGPNLYTAPQNQSYQGQQNPMQQAPMFQKQNFLPMTFVNGLIGAKAYIVPAGQTIFLKDSDSDYLYKKEADNMGAYKITAYKLNEVSLEEIENPNVTKEKKEDIYITKSDFKAYTDQLEERLNKLSRSNSNGYRKQYNRPYNKGDK